METLKELRKIHQVKQRELAEYLNVTVSTYSRYENGKRQPDYETLLLLADYYAVSVDYLLGRTVVGEATLLEDVKPMLKKLEYNEDLDLLFIKTNDMSKNELDKFIKLLDNLKRVKNKNNQRWKMND